MKKEAKRTNTIYKTKKSDVSDFLKSTGFILEMEVADYLKSKDYSVKVNELYFDYDENKNREIDLVATKRINEIELTLIIECKQSQDKDWVFICSDKKPPLYYNYVKYLPGLEYKKGPKETGIFNNTHILNETLPLAQNAVIRQNNGKKAQEDSIWGCLKKLPKALVDYAYNNSAENKRKIYIPLVVFSNQFFSASYDGELIVKEQKIIQHSTVLDSPIYKYKYKQVYNNSVYSSVMFPSSVSSLNDNHESVVDVNIPVSKISWDLGIYYLIDFSTKKGLNEYLKTIEKGVYSINLEYWKLKNEEKRTEIPPSV